MPFHRKNGIWEHYIIWNKNEDVIMKKHNSRERSYAILSPCDSLISVYEMYYLSTSGFLLCSQVGVSLSSYAIFISIFILCTYVIKKKKKPMSHNKLK